MRSLPVVPHTDLDNCKAVTDREARRRPGLLVATGSLALLVGVLVYLADRDASRALLIPAIAALAGHPMYGVWGQWLPSFVHPFAFSLFTAAALPERSTPSYGACVVWCAINLAFEIGQHPAFKAGLVDALQGDVGRFWPTRAVANYLLRGTFDAGDIVAALCGALTAAAVLHRFHRKLGGAKHAQ